MIKYLVFDLGSREENDAAFTELNDSINKTLGYPNNQGTNNYANPVIHPDGEKIVMPIMDEVLKILPDEHQKNLTDVLTKDWTPVRTDDEDSDK